MKFIQNQPNTISEPECHLIQGGSHVHYQDMTGAPRVDAYNASDTHAIIQASIATSLTKLVVLFEQSQTQTAQIAALLNDISGEQLSTTPQHNGLDLSLEPTHENESA